MSGSHDPNDPTPGQSVSSRILVIEDSFFQAVEITNILKADGHQVQTARDGTTGLHLAKTWLPRIILLDLGLPDIHGLDVVDRLRAEEATRAMAIIVMTGYAMQHAAAAARLGKGLDGLLLKPFSPADLRRVISPLPS